MPCVGDAGDYRLGRVRLVQLCCFDQTGFSHQLNLARCRLAFYLQDAGRLIFRLPDKSVRQL